MDFYQNLRKLLFCKGGSSRSRNFFYLKSYKWAQCFVQDAVLLTHFDLSCFAFILPCLQILFSPLFPRPMAGPICAVNSCGHISFGSWPCVTYLILLFTVFCFYTRPLHRMRRCFHSLILLIPLFTVFICSSDLPIGGTDQAKSVISVKYILCMDLLLLSCSSFIYVSWTELKINI